MAEMSLADLRDDDVYTPKQIADITSKRAAHVNMAIRNGRLAAARLGPRAARVLGASVRKWLLIGAPRHAMQKFDAGTIRNLIAKHPITGRIYFARCADFVKIGFTLDIEQRLVALNCNNPFEVDILGTIPGSVMSEKAIHAQLRDLKQKLEWFHLTPELLAIIKELCHVDRH